MGMLTRKGRVLPFSQLRAMKSIGVVFGVVGMMVLIYAFGCETRGGVRVSEAAPEQAEGALATKAAAANLKNSHCVVCHDQQPQTIAAHGAKHKTEVGCMDCHQEHPPEGTGAIPECSMCHSGAPHYELAQCGSCHADTHAPLDLTLEGELTGPCLTCHQQQGDEVQAHPSAHTDVACNECHAAHRQIPDCMECHEKHTEDMDFEACLSCHPVHMPTVIAFVPKTPSHYCQGCHDVAYDLLEKSTTKHHDVACAVCHEGKHMTVPPCAQCHPDQHPPAILEKFPACGQCHGIAHDLVG